MDDLTKLEYPRLMHNAGASKRVENADEAKAAQAEGYTVKPVLTPEQEKAVAAAQTKAGEKKAHAAADDKSKK